MKSNLVMFLALILIVTVVASSVSALDGYVSITASKQGKLKGDNVVGHPDEMAFSAMSHEISSPRDAGTGLATGKRQHKPLTITKEWGASTPQLYQALATNENLPKVVLNFYNGNTVVYTITLTNAQISDIQSDFSNAKGTDSVSFTYQKIEWKYAAGSIMASDDWSASVV